MNVKFRYDIMSKVKDQHFANQHKANFKENQDLAEQFKERIQVTDISILCKATTSAYFVAH